VNWLKNAIETSRKEIDRMLLFGLERKDMIKRPTTTREEVVPFLEGYVPALRGEKVRSDWRYYENSWDWIPFEDSVGKIWNGKTSGSTEVFAIRPDYPDSGKAIETSRKEIDRMLLFGLERKDMIKRPTTTREEVVKRLDGSFLRRWSDDE